MRTIETHVDVDADAATAWSVLTDFAAIGDWNPFVRRIEGEAVVGRRLRVELSPPGGRTMAFRPRVTIAERNRALEWLGCVGLPRLFDGRHRFELEPLPDGRTRLHHGERFTGVLVPLLWRAMSASTAAGFEQFNAAFADRCRAAATGTAA